MNLQKILGYLVLGLTCMVVVGCYTANDVGVKELEIKKQLFVPEKYELHSGEGTEKKPYLYRKTAEATEETVTLWTNYAGRLSDSFSAMSDASSNAERAAALAIIGAAVTASGAIVFDGSSNLLKGAGLAAGTIAALTTYLRPRENAAVLLNAAQKLHCIEYAGARADALLNDVPEAIELMKSSVRKATLTLRSQLQSNARSYEEIVRDLVATQNVNLAPEVSSPNKHGVTAKTLNVHMKNLNSNIRACFI